MKTRTLDTLKQTLLERRTELERDLDHMESELRDLSVDQEDERGGVGNHFADDGSSLGEQERISTVGSDFREQIQMIDAAIERMDEGTYGICQRCGQQIQVERLEALPFAAYCITCQSHLEQQAELFGGSIHPS
jgi:RNA polymerase-binding protein DksA